MGKDRGQVEFTPVDVGDMSDIPPDLPAGAWVAQCSVKKHTTKDGGYPCLILDWKTTEALTEANEDHVGGKTSEFLTFFPAGHKGYRMGCLRLKGLCEALEIEVPAISRLESWDDLADFIGELEGRKATIYTSVEERKDTGEKRTVVRYTAPGGALAKAAAARKGATDDDADEKAPTKRVGPNGRPLKAKKRAA